MVIIQCKIDGQTLFIDRHGFWQLERAKADRLNREDAQAHIEASYTVRAMQRAGGVISLEHP